jgi:hypothetical protein
MKKPASARVLAGLALALLAAGASAQDQPAPAWKAQGDLDMMLGQYYFNGAAGSVNGYGNADVQLLRTLSNDWGFYIEGQSTYTGFKQVDELAGGGTLFQQSWDNYAGLKWVKRYDDGWSLKPRIGVRDELFRETVDETWGDGLYDFWRGETGLVWEHKTRLNDEVPWIWQLSYDLYYTHYPHFQSLTSQFGTEQTAPNPGSRILDTVSNQFGYRNEYDLPNFVSAWIFYSISFVSFTDQKVVQSQGQFLGAKRADTDQTLNFGANKRFDDWQVLGRVRPVAALNFTFADQMSNQNDFDADPSRLKYTASYYDYWEAHVNPSLTTTFLGTKTTARLSAEFAMRCYTGRLGQNADGSYTGNRLHQYTESVNFDAAQPVWRDLEVKARVAWSNTSANTAYEQTYVYNYSDFNYFAGLGWRFQ